MDVIFDLIAKYLGEITAFIFGLGIVAGYYRKFKKLIREVAELFNAIDEANADGRLDAAEVVRIKNESIDVWNAVKSFAKKPKNENGR